MPRVCIVIQHPTDPTRKFIYCSVEIVNSDHDDSIEKSFKVDLSKNLMDIISGLIQPCYIIRIYSGYDGKTVIRIKESPCAIDIVFREINEIICKFLHHNLSLSDAEIIIKSLKLLDYVYCINTDRAECLVVFEEFERFPSYQKKPSQLFKEAVDMFNRSRTVVMTRAQCDTLLSEEMKPSVEFSSVLPDNQIEVVFRREAIQTVFREIERLVKINNLEQELTKLTSSSN
jgi:hypothetical protein